MRENKAKNDSKRFNIFFWFRWTIDYTIFWNLKKSRQSTRNRLKFIF
jgi:hypothetical protein